MDKKIYQIQKLARRKTGYPLATVAYYGPDNQFASKVVVGIQLSENAEGIADLKKWFATELDVRKDMKIFHEIADYLAANQVQRIAMVDRIIGCPHEEGIDYPEGESCPQCPYWANRDRWTGEIIN